MITTLRPGTPDGSTIQWTREPVSGDHFDKVDDDPVNNARYLTAQESGLADNFALTDSPAGTGLVSSISVRGVFRHSFSGPDPAGTVGVILRIINSSGSVLWTTNEVFTSDSGGWLTRVIGQASSVHLTKSEIDAATFVLLSDGTSWAFGQGMVDVSELYIDIDHTLGKTISAVTITEKTIASLSPTEKQIGTVSQTEKTITTVANTEKTIVTVANTEKQIVTHTMTEKTQ